MRLFAAISIFDIQFSDKAGFTLRYNQLVRIRSLTFYDTKEGFFIPNKEKKCSVGQNAGMKLNAESGIEIHVAAEQPKGVPAENWLPITREDLGIGLIMRVYQPDLEKMKTWKAPKAEMLE